MLVNVKGLNMGNKLTQTALELLMINNDLPHRLNYSKPPYQRIDDFELYIFEQVWGSTALGFGGIGGQAMTRAMTYVFVPINVKQKCYVYFAGQFAYSVPYSDYFMNDVMKKKMEPVYSIGKYNIEEV